MPSNKPHFMQLTKLNDAYGHRINKEKQLSTRLIKFPKFLFLSLIHNCEYASNVFPDSTNFQQLG